MLQMVKAEMDDLLIKIEGHEALGRIEEREAAVIQLVSLAKIGGMQAGFRTVLPHSAAPKPDWAGDVVAYVVLPNNKEIAYFLREDTSAYEGYTRADKLARIKTFIEGDGLNG